jgi:hypothetical protein
MAYIGSSPSTQTVSSGIDYFNGDGSTTEFTLSRVVLPGTQIIVLVNNIVQNPSSAYTVLNNTITFTSSPSSGSNNIYVIYQAQTVVSSTIAAGSTSGATGGGNDTIFVNNSKTVTTSYAIPAGLNSTSTGPIVIDDGAVITLTGTTRWVVN